MLINFLIMYVIFPITALWGMKWNQKTSGDNDSLFVKSDTNYLKGLAAIMVLLAHYCLRLEEEGRLFTLLSPFKYLGPLGVAIFFFISGYGLYVSNGFEKLSLNFLLKRLKNVYIPYLFVHILFVPVLHILKLPNDTILDIVLYVLGFTISVSWFVIVIMILYVLYYLVSKLSVKDDLKILFLSFAIIGVSIILYCIFGLEKSYWYGNNIIFSVGVLCGRWRHKINSLIIKRIKILLPLNILLLGIMCVAFFKVNDYAELCVKCLMGLLLCFAMIQFVKIFELRSKILCWCGSFSLYLYITHTNLYLIMRNFLDMSNPVVTVLYFIIAFVCPCFIKKIVDWVLDLKIANKNFIQ